MKVLVTGAAGFIGSNFVGRALDIEPDFSILALDKLTYAGNLKNLDAYRDNDRFHFVRGDITDAETVGPLMKEVDAVVHMAAETHVDRSIMGPAEFIETNIMGTLVLLEAAREAGVSRFLQISTDEVYGSLGPRGKFTEDTPLAPNSPYSASKASADMLVRSFFVTYGFPTLITRCSNNYGPYQFPEKLIPLFIANALEGRELPIYGDGLQIRDWIHVKDHCGALLKVLKDGEPGEVYNIGGGNEITNLELTGAILNILGKPESLIKHVKDRPGHDRRYAIDIAKINLDLGWEPSVPFKEGVEATVEWYLDNDKWLAEVRSGEYRDYYERWYGDRC